MDAHGNTVAEEGCTRCECGSKYWEHDRCIDCGAKPPAGNSNGFTTDKAGATCVDCGAFFSVDAPFRADGRVQRAHRRHCPVNPVDVYEPMVCR